MEFQIEKDINPNKEKYHKEEFDVAHEFSDKLVKEFGTFVKAVVLFGSSARKEKPHDIDILVVVDDISIKISPEMSESYRIIVEKLVVDVSNRLHVTTMKLTSFWENIRTGDPVGINMLRDGIAIIDSGFFDPMQALLRQGRIRPTKEAIWTYFSRAPATMYNSKWHLLQATLDLYWAVIDASHAVLMLHGEIPPSPAHVADLMDERLVKKGLLPKRYTQIMREFYKISRMILHREIREVKGQEYDKYFAEAHAFINRMKAFIEKGEK